MSDDYDALVWLDLETTGSNERTGHILEIGMVATTAAPPFAEQGFATFVVLPDDPDWQESMGDTVARMHDRNGLVDDVAAKGLPLVDVVAECCNWLRQTTGKGARRLLAGSGVGHFDRRWLREHARRLDRKFDYPVLDVGVLRRAFELMGLVDVPALDAGDKPHRALADARLHLAEFRVYQQWLGHLATQGGAVAGRADR